LTEKITFSSFRQKHPQTKVVNLSVYCK
jgi:hypothetical protein